MGERENKYVSECERVKKEIFVLLLFFQSVSHTRTQKIVFIITQNFLYTPRHRRM